MASSLMEELRSSATKTTEGDGEEDPSDEEDEELAEEKAPESEEARADISDGYFLTLLSACTIVVYVVSSVFLFGLVQNDYVISINLFLAFVVAWLEVCVLYGMAMRGRIRPWTSILAPLLILSRIHNALKVTIIVLALSVVLMGLSLVTEFALPVRLMLIYVATYFISVTIIAAFRFFQHAHVVFDDGVDAAVISTSVLVLGPAMSVLKFLAFASVHQKALIASMKLKKA